MHIDASKPGYPDTTAARSPMPPTLAQQWGIALLWLGLTVISCASLYPLTPPGLSWLPVLTSSAHDVLLWLRVGIPGWLWLIIARVQLRIEQRLGLAVVTVCCLALYVWTSPGPQRIETMVKLLYGGIFGLVWLTLSITPWWVWRGALPTKPAPRRFLEERVHAFARASLWLFALCGLVGRTLPWFDGILVSLMQVMHLSWSSMGAYAAVLSVRARRPDLVARSLFALLVPISIFMFYVSFGALGLR